jgi:hypothetical protein
MYQELDITTTNELSLLRHGWWSPEYELTNGLNKYGQLGYDGISKRNAEVRTATCTLYFNFEELFSRTILITDSTGSVIGKCTRDLFSRTSVLTLTSGFSAIFARVCLGIGRIRQDYELEKPFSIYINYRCAFISNKYTCGYNT